jgi:hypothetical protein
MTQLSDKESMAKYSDKEQRLIYALHFEDFLSQEPAVTYRALALHCFSRNLQNYLSDNVRRCYNALQEGAPYCLTKDFDDLIEFPCGRTSREYADDNWAGIC